VFSCSESEQKQLNTWVSFQSAEQPLMGHFSVSGNTVATGRSKIYTDDYKNARY
jgi:DNA helicase-2/ATP-dependent DNA helicase PcrA